MLGANGSRVFRGNPEGIRLCVWLACLNFGVKIEARKYERKYDVESCDIYLLQSLRFDTEFREADPSRHTYLNRV